MEKSKNHGFRYLIIPIVIALFASIYAVVTIKGLNEEIQYLNQRIDSMEKSMKKVDSLSNHIGVLCLKIDSTFLKKNKPNPIPGSYKRNHYGKQLPSELIILDGWTSVCGTIYNPDPKQCLSTKVTASGRKIDEMIKDSLFYCIAITKALRNNGFRLHDTIELQYMDKNGNWNNLVNQNGKIMRGYIEDSMGPRLNNFFCIDILMSKEQMKDAPFDGLTKFRIRK